MMHQVKVLVDKLDNLSDNSSLWDPHGRMTREPHSLILWDNTCDGLSGTFVPNKIKHVEPVNVKLLGKRSLQMEWRMRRLPWIRAVSKHNCSDQRKEVEKTKERRLCGDGKETAVDC